MASRVSILSESKSERFHARVKEFNLECSVFHRALLADQLIQPVPLDRARAVCVGIGSVVVSRRGAVQFDYETNWLAIFCGAEDQVKVAGMKAENNFAGNGFQHSAFFAYFPASAQSPLIQRKPGLRGGIEG